MTRLTTQPRAHQRGFSLIEALIAMVVLSLGLLGLAGLQVSSLKFNQTAQLRSKAVTLAYDMQERVRASGSNATNGDFNVGFGAFTSATTFPDQQITDWKARLAAQLPLGDGSVCTVSNPAAPGACDGGPFFVISVRWSEANDVTAARQAQTIQIVSRE
ncbi:type IV pilus modification protein PilV [Zoogloeaceae bacterium G21618-S1]|nr:type IV pilus modification protein PilV [Zoogloeaceae bacterium G21618-S1]